MRVVNVLYCTGITSISVGIRLHPRLNIPKRSPIRAPVVEDTHSTLVVKRRLPAISEKRTCARRNCPFHPWAYRMACRIRVVIPPVTYIKNHASGKNDRVNITPEVGHVRRHRSAVQPPGVMFAMPGLVEQVGLLLALLLRRTRCSAQRDKACRPGRLDSL